MRETRPLAAIVDFGMGNLFSVSQACGQVGLDSIITANPKQALSADAIILPGVGAFGKAMEVLRQTGMNVALREAATLNKPFLGVCLGLQLLLSESDEFGKQAGLGIVSGRVTRLLNGEGANAVKVPHVGWNQVWRPRMDLPSRPRRWYDSVLEDLPNGEFFYFVHSFQAIPDSVDALATETTYGSNRFCSSLHHQEIFACQFHPERSGPQGLRFYQALADHLRSRPAVPNFPGERP